MGGIVKGKSYSLENLNKMEQNPIEIFKIFVLVSLDYSQFSIDFSFK